jgi:hypothetical protein
VVAARSQVAGRQRDGAELDLPWPPEEAGSGCRGRWRRLRGRVWHGRGRRSWSNAVEGADTALPSAGEMEDGLLPSLCLPLSFISERARKDRETPRALCRDISVALKR